MENFWTITTPPPAKHQGKNCHTATPSAQAEQGASISTSPAVMRCPSFSCPLGWHQRRLSRDLETSVPPTSYNPLPRASGDHEGTLNFHTHPVVMRWHLPLPQCQRKVDGKPRFSPPSSGAELCLTSTYAVSVETC